jgi:sec-independent protein translocase protein TatA
VVALLIFGPKRLPEIGSGLGKSIRAFRASMEGEMAKDTQTIAPGEETTPHPH